MDFPEMTVEEEFESVKLAMRYVNKIEIEKVLKFDTVTLLKQNGYDVTSFGCRPTITIIEKL